MRFNQDAVIDVGKPPPGYHQEWATRTVCFHGFGSLSTVRGARGRVESPEFEGFGNQWFLKLYPGGDASADEGMVSLYLCNRSNKAIEIDYGFSMIDGKGKHVEFEQYTAREVIFGPVGLVYEVTRSDVMSSLVNGTLVIEVRMKLSNPNDAVPFPFIPENPSACKIIQGLFLNKKSADIMFEVGGGEKPKNNAMKAAKPAPVSFPAHRCIVENCSSIFADLCESHNDCAAIQINDVIPDIFSLLLSFMYGAKLSDDDMKSHAKDVIDAADKYGVVNLKLEAEACFVEATTFTIENVMEHLHYAESKNCALLKEAAMDYIVKNKGDVIEKLSFANAPRALITDVLAAVSRGERNVDGNDGGGGESQYNAMRISELRKRAHEKGLSFDGSREMIIAALKAKLEVISQEEGK